MMEERVKELEEQVKKLQKLISTVITNSSRIEGDICLLVDKQNIVDLELKNLLGELNLNKS